MGLTRGGVFGAWRRCGYSGKLMFARMRDSGVLQTFRAHAGGKYGPNLGRSVRLNGSRLRYSGVSRSVRAHARRMGGIKPLESAGRHERRRGGRRLRGKRSVSAGGPPLPPGGFTRLKVRA